MTIQELKTVLRIRELEQTRLLTRLEVSVQNPQLVGYLSTGNLTNFLYVEGSTAWLFDFVQLLCLCNKLIEVLIVYQ